MAFALRATEKVSLVNDEEELRKRGYRVSSTLGEGSYAKVKCAHSQSLGKKIALKIINRKKAPKDFQQKFLPRELEVMKLIDHPNIIRLYEIMQFGGKVYIAMEMAGHGDLLEYIKLRGAIDEAKSRTMFRQLLSAVEYLHSISVVHRDLKCENILLDSQNNIKVSDFGFSRILGKDDLSRTFCGSAAYAAPEILQGVPYRGICYDIWSLGVILYIMVCGSMPYDDSNIKKMIKTQIEKKVGFSRNRRLSEEVRSMIHCMLEAEIVKRYSIPAIKMHPWMQVYDPVVPPRTAAPAATAATPSIPRRTSSLIPEVGGTQGGGKRRCKAPSPPQLVAREIQTAKPRTEPPAQPSPRSRSPASHHPRTLPPLKQQTPLASTPPNLNSEDSLADALTVRAVIPSAHKPATGKSSSGSRDRHISSREKHLPSRDRAPGNTKNQSNFNKI